MTEYENTSQVFRQYLAPDEHLVWSGKPEKIRILTKRDIFLVPFSLLWCGFAIFWESMAVGHDTPVFFKLFGIPFVLVGLYISVGRLIQRYFTLKNTSYAVTDKRILILNGKKLEVLSGSNLPPMSVITYSDGTGTIHFDTPNDFYRRRDSWNWYGYAFESIQNVYNVQNMILNINRY